MAFDKDNWSVLGGQPKAEQFQPCIAIQLLKLIQL